ncbi:unnamed protein product [Closterium sp. Naga37s-1]|nr:unnamed protein product [Closterium sp. Naga37s-1]
MAKDDDPQKAAPSQLVSKKSSAQEPQKKMSPGEEMESEWQQIVDYYDPANVEKRAEEARKKELQALQSAMEANREQEQILEEFYGIKPRPKQSLEELEAAAAEVAEEEEWNFPQDPDKWTEADLGEEWADAPADAKVPFYDPLLGLSALDAADDDADADDGRRRRKAPRKQQRAKLPHSEDRYVPYRQGLPPVNEMDDGSSGALKALEELEMEEEFLQWASYVFRDGATYEGTVWNDMAQGKGVYTTPLELCKYEGEWVQNMMQGHGVVSVDVPARLPPPDSEAWRKLKAEGKVFEDEEMSAEDREWLRMELEDLSTQESEAKKAGGVGGEGAGAVEDPTDAVPFEDHPGWLKVFGRKPEKGHYEYAGQMKQNKFHGCGVFTLNGKMHFGKFRFGEFLRNKDECDAHTSGFHAGMARVAAAKARMFVNKPDGMVREVKGPYNEPSHPYLYDEDDMWQVPGFIHEFHDVPAVWRKYADEVDGERQLWLNSFKKAPLRLPSPSELSYLWDQKEEFVVLRNSPRLPERAGESAEEAEMRRADMQGQVLVHVPSRQIINWTTDEEGKLRLFVQPFTKDGKVDPSKARPLPLGFDEFIKGEEMEQEEEDEEEEESEEARRLKTPEQLQRDAERRRAKAAEARRRRVARWERTLRNRVASRREQREEEWARQDAEEEELRQLEEEEWQREGDLMDAEFEARLDAAEGILPAGEEEEEDGAEGADQAQEEEAAGKGVVKGSAASAAAAGAKAAAGASGAGEEEEGSESESEGESDDEDEEERKPRSFGTVAMAAGGSEGREEGGAGEGWLRGPAAAGSSTVFASISLSSQVALQHAIHHAARSISSLRRLLPSPSPSTPTASPSPAAAPLASPSLPPALALMVRMPSVLPLTPCLRASALSSAARHAPVAKSSSRGAARASHARQQQHPQEVAVVGGILSLALPLPATPPLA